MILQVPSQIAHFARSLRLILLLLALAVGFSLCVAPVESLTSPSWITSTKNAISWGYNGAGQLGLGWESFLEPPRFVRIPTIMSDTDLPGFTGKLSFSAIASGKDSVIGIEAGTNRVFVWGSNSKNKLGLGTRPTVSPLGPVPDVSRAKTCPRLFTLPMESLYSQIWWPLQMMHFGFA